MVAMRFDPSARNHVRANLHLAVALAIGIGLAATPLFGTPGFEHALVISLLSWLWASWRATGNHAHTLWRVLATRTRAAVVVVTLLALPSYFAAALWRGLCDVAFAFQALLAISYTSAVCAAIALTACTRLAQRLAGARVARFVAPLALLSLLAHALWRFYAEPPVFSFSPLAGFFPGNLYDELIQLRRPFWLARLDLLLATLALATFALRFADTQVRTPRRQRQLLAGALMLATAWLYLHWHSSTLGYQIDASALRRHLPLRHQSAHFTIFAADTPELREQLPLIAADHEFRYQQVVARFGAAPAGRITSYYFADSEDKARWFGARHVEMAKPWRREIYLDHRAFPHPSLRHEIAHVVASAAGDPWFGVAAKRVAGLPLLVNPGLIEGLAVALDWPGSYDRQQTPHQAVATMAQLGYLPSVKRLFSLGFLASSSTRSYATAGSFVRFVLDTYGPTKTRALYANGGDMKMALGVSEAEVAAAWEAQIRRIAVPAEDLARNKERFRSTGVFARPCPHAVAALQAAIADALAQGDLTMARRMAEQLCTEDPSEPQHALLRARLELASSATEAAGRQRLDHIISNMAFTDSVRIAASLALITDLGRHGAWARAEAVHQGTHALAADESSRRVLAAMELAFSSNDRRAPALRGYFFSHSDDNRVRVAWADALVHIAPNDGLGYYLRGLRRLDLADQRAADQRNSSTESANRTNLENDARTGLLDLQRALDLPLPHPSFARFAARQLARAGFVYQDHGAVARAVRQLRSEANEVDRLLAQDWQERLDFTMGR